MKETCETSQAICADIAATAGTNQLAERVFEKMKNITFTGDVC